MNGWLFGGAVGSSMIAYGVAGLWRERNKKACIPPDSPEAPERLTLEEIAPSGPQISDNMQSIFLCEVISNEMENTPI